jgi:hypothetical protein
MLAVPTTSEICHRHRWSNPIFDGLDVPTIFVRLEAGAGIDVAGVAREPSVGAPDDKVLERLVCAFGAVRERPLEQALR